MAEREAGSVTRSGLRANGFAALGLAAALSLGTSTHLASPGGRAKDPTAGGSVAGQTAGGAATSAAEESEVLRQAFESASGNPQALIKNLEDFLARFPDSPRRDQVLRTIFHQALQANDRARATIYAEKLLDVHPVDPEFLSALVDLLERQSDTTGRERALQYCGRFIERAEKLQQSERPADVPADKWPEIQAMMLATGYMLRGRVYAMSGEVQKALADCEKSYAAYPTASVAERLGDLETKLGDTDRAIEHYATAFAFPEQTLDPTRREQVRKKLGSAYLARFRSEKGLGDLILARYDELSRTLGSRTKAQGRPNAGLRDPFDFVLRRLDGTELRLKDYRGKVVVMDFWATWCAPCRVEGRLLERVRETFRDNSAAIFLAVNVDEDRNLVPAFLQEEKWTVPVVYAQDLDHLLGARALPTLVIFGREGEVVFRQEGLDAGSFIDTVEKKVREALGPAGAGAGTPGPPR